MSPYGATMARIPIQHWFIVGSVTSFVLGFMATAFVSWVGQAWWAILLLGVAMRALPGTWLAYFTYRERATLTVKRPWLTTVAIVLLTMLAISRPCVQLALGPIETNGVIERSERVEVYLRGKATIGGHWWRGFRITVRTDAAKVVVLMRSGPDASRCHELHAQGASPRVLDRTLRWYLNERQTISFSCHAPQAG